MEPIAVTKKSALGAITKKVAAMLVFLRLESAVAVPPALGLPIFKSAAAACALAIAARKTPEIPIEIDTFAFSRLLAGLLVFLLKCSYLLLSLSWMASARFDARKLLRPPLRHNTAALFSIRAPAAALDVAHVAAARPFEPAAPAPAPRASAAYVLLFRAI